MTALPVIVVRPEPGNAATLGAARAQGLDAHGFPLFAMEPVAWACPDPAGFDGILAGSANVFRLGGAALGQLATLPVHVVGETTATAARAAGFPVGNVGEGGLQNVLDTLPGQRLLRLAGEEHIALVPACGTIIETRVVYAARAQALPAPLVALLAERALVMLHSGEAARHFAAACDCAGIDRSQIALACLAPRIAALCGEGWNRVETASARTDAALLALARQMCQKVHFGVSGQKD